jgi:hypothetical protein
MLLYSGRGLRANSVRLVKKQRPERGDFRAVREMAIWMKWGENKPNRRSNSTTGDVGGRHHRGAYVDFSICYYHANFVTLGIMNDLMGVVRSPGLNIVQI